jgi:ferredoxin
LKLVPLEQIDLTPAVIEHIQQNEQLYRVELDDVAAEELGVITGSAMIKDETRCIRCGLCAERCPVQVITMEAYHLVTEELPQLIQIQAR